MPKFQYRLADHLGNTVVFFEDKNADGCIKTEDQATSQADLEIVQRLLYYPFGMALEGLGAWSAQPWQQYRYNGKERDTLTGWYEYGFRWYIDGIGRFTGVDPIADQFAHVSVYNYAENSPIGNIDLHGLQKSDITKGKQLNAPAWGVAYVYYVGPKNRMLFLIGHTGLGYYGKYDAPNSTVLYDPTSGNSSERESRSVAGPRDLSYEYNGVSEVNTLKGYLDAGETVERYHYFLPDKVTESFQAILEGNVISFGNSLDGEWCTLQCSDAFYQAFIGGGYSEKEARKSSSNIIYYNFPERLTKSEIRKTGSIRYDRFYKEDGKYYQEINSYDSDSKKWKTSVEQIHKQTKND